MGGSVGGTGAAALQLSASWMQQCVVESLVMKQLCFVLNNGGGVRFKSQEEKDAALILLPPHVPANLGVVPQRCCYVSFEGDEAAFS